MTNSNETTGYTINFMIDYLQEELGSNGFIDEITDRIENTELFNILKDIATKNSLFYEINEELAADLASQTDI